MKVKQFLQVTFGNLYLLISKGLCQGSQPSDLGRTLLVAYCQSSHGPLKTIRVSPGVLALPVVNLYK